MKREIAKEHYDDNGKVEMFAWSPLPQRKKLIYRIKTESNGNKKLYPNCDGSVWLRTCEEEIIEPLNGTITGTIPSWLQGSLVRNGPGMLKVGDECFQHLFDGAALLHKFLIANGDVKYQCRFLQSDIYKKNTQAKRIIMTEFGTKSVVDPCNSIFNRVASMFTPHNIMTDNSMISVYPFRDELFAFGEGPIIHRLTQDLDVDKQVNMYEKIGIINHSSHPHVMKDGTVFNLGMTIHLSGPKHNIICFPSKNKSSEMFDDVYIAASVPVRWPLNPSYMHTFGITETYFIIVEQPLSLSLPSLINCKLKNDPMIGSLSWYNNEMTQISVLCRKTGNRLHTFYSEAFFYLHIINQYEKDDYIVIDICAYRDPSMINCMFIEAMQNMQQNPTYAKMFRGRPLRFILPLNKNTDQFTFPNSDARAEIMDDGNVLVIPETLCNLGCETPRINYENWLSKEYRYFYAISSDVDAKNPGTIIKVDVKEKTYLTWCEDNCYPSEPVFVPRNANSKDEDDGVILSAIIWGQHQTNRVGLLILDAKTMQEIGRSEFTTPSPVPKCLHGWFMPQ